MTAERPLTGGWRATRGFSRAVVITGLLVVAGVVLGRPDVVLLAAPFALGTAWALHRRPRTAPAVTVTVEEPIMTERGEAAGAVSITNSDPSRYDLLVLDIQASRWLDLPESQQPQVITVPGQRIAELPLRSRARRWGRHRVGPARVTVLACHGLLMIEPDPAPAAGLTAHPLTERFDAAEAMPRAAGLMGPHPSQRPGEGGELVGVRQFAPGDRLRRVDWRVSLRTRQLHVAATLSDRDAEVVLVLDVLADAAGPEGVGGPGSVLDTTVRAAAAIAEHYLHRGDRVSLVEYGRAARRLRPASGRRQYLAVREWLLDTSAGDSVDIPYDQVFGPHLLSGNALIIVLTPLIDPSVASLLARLARGGRFVVAVDTLPAAARRRSDTAARLWRLERDNTVGGLREHGVPVVAWAGAGSLDRVLLGMARAARTPRPGVR